MKFLDKNGLTYLWGKIQTALDRKKNTQTAVSSPAASGNTLAFIDTISQNAQGVISATKKNVTVDNTPTAGSTNPVTSGGVYAATDDILKWFGLIQYNGGIYVNPDQGQ